MKKILLMALLAATFFSCSNEENEEPQGTKLKSLEFALGIATPKTRMADGTVTNSTITAVRNNIEGITIEYFNSSDASLGTYNFSTTEITTVKSDDQSLAIDAEGRHPVRIENIPSATTKVNVYLNVKSSNNINDLQTSYNVMEYAGENAVTITLVGAGAGTSGNDLYRVEVPVKPVLSRFEFKGSASDIKINNDGNGTLPTGVTDGTKAEAQSHVTDATIATAEKSARDAWKLANPGAQEPETWTYSYTVTYQYNSAYTITGITGYYMNNISLTKGGTPVLNGNNAGGDWNDAANTSYSANGSMKKMFDTNTPTDDNVIAYNLFPQIATNAESATIAEVKASMPHFILKLTVNEAPTTRWLTIRALTNIGDNKLVKSFEAGKVYVLDAADIKINQYSAKLKVTANNVAGPEIPEVIDPVDPNPEPVGKDLDILVKIMDWETVNVKPEW